MSDVIKSVVLRHKKPDLSAIEGNHEVTFFTPKKLFSHLQKFADKKDKSPASVMTAILKLMAKDPELADALFEESKKYSIKEFIEHG